MTRAIPLLTLAGCAHLGRGVDVPDVSQARFVDGIDNPFLPYPVGASWTYQAGNETIQVDVTGETIQIMGVTALVVHDRSSVDGVTTEDTNDWFAQDSTGTVWYLGEDTCAFEHGVCADGGGSWQWGVDGALPGWAMPADPQVDGHPYHQEWYRGHAEDVGEVIAVDVSVDTPAGSFTGCVRTHDTSTVEKGDDEEKTYCPGIGLVFTDEGGGTEALQRYAGLPAP